MRAAPPLPHEDARLSAVRQTGLLGAEADPELEELVRLATLACRAPSGTIALLDRDEVVFRARVGFDVLRLPRLGSFCSWVALGPEPLVVGDSWIDERFSQENVLPWRFGAGAPLVRDDGLVLGALCVHDAAPRGLDREGREALALLARRTARRVVLPRPLVQEERAHAELSRTLFELTDRETRLSAILDTAVEGILTIDGEGVIQSFNRAAERMFGWPAAEVIGRNVSMLMPEPDHSRHDGYLRRYLATGEAHIVGGGREVRGRRRDGSLFPLYLAVSEVRPCRTGRLFTGIVRDISELKEADRLKREFVSVVSHELRTPLTSIRGALGLIGGGAVGALSEQAGELVGIARVNADRLVRLLGDILDLEKIESGRLELFLQPLAARELVESTLGGLRPLADEAGVPLSIDGPNSPFIGDRDRLQQVLTNLVANAVKFSPAGSAVTVALLDHSPATPGSIRFEVADRGPGIARDDLPRLFQPFQQLDGSDRRVKGGTGLGLAIAKALVEKHDGTIGVASEPGVGSTFWFEVPSNGPASARRRAGLERAGQEVGL